ncbi:MAG: PAS domain-containing protein [Sulfurospirillaceae bacterium]|jgi:aerotaxis receptor|nr:PAS domain-containing protein [Sulfurospirillaceae bacterium]MDD2826562.1 PAS domain-containing protein [Sulfurospirillaceae bacterium]
MTTTYQMFIETIVPNNQLIVSRTDLHGIITYANDTFAEISGYKVEELIGQPHNIVRHPDMPKSIFKEIWESVTQEQKWQGYVKNLRKDGGYYWVYAEISGVYKGNQLIEYKSMRSPIDNEIKIAMQKRYDELRTNEEGQSRVVLYLKNEHIRKIQKLSREEGRSEDSIIDDFLEDALF